MSVRTRFAPSPTGFMHIGGMRTALFNWLFARANGGQFLLRIDDTDQSRNVDAALEPILDAFRWLQLDWDEGPEVGGSHGPYFQSQRGEHYTAAVEQLLAEGKAYRDFDSPDLIKQDRELAEKEKRNYINVRRSLELSEEAVQEKLAADEPYVVRLLVPRDQRVSIDDRVRGNVEWNCAEISDPVLCRADGSPLYNLATVVDDIAMEITHVIRAEEHLTNSSVQAMLFDALGAKRPEFAHIPFVAAPGGSRKLSKREKDLEKYRGMRGFQKLFQVGDSVLPQIGISPGPTMNPVMVAYYQEVGFLPEAIVNGLSRLGWSYDDQTENMSREFVSKNFSLDRIVKAPAGLDPDKLMSYQEHWIAEMPGEAKLSACLRYLARAGRIAEPVSASDAAFVDRLLNALGERIKLLSDVLAYDEYFVADDAMKYDAKAFKKRLANREDAVGLLGDYRNELETAEPFDAATLEQSLNAFCDSHEIGVGQIIHALRIATTGKPAGPGMFDALELLGRERVLARIDRTLTLLKEA